VSSAILLTFGPAQRARAQTAAPTPAQASEPTPTQPADPAPAQAAEPAPTIELVVKAGRPLQVALDKRIRVKRVGQPVTGTLVDPVYGYDRILIPAGTEVLGHVAKLEGASKLVRARAILGGDLTPVRHVVLEFDTMVLEEGRQIPVKTVVSGGIPHPKRSVAASSEAKETRGGAARAGDEAKAQV
jgi:hypothetical protein